MPASFASLDDKYWSERYQTRQTGWDIGQPSTPLQAYIDQLEDKNIAILIPGCGNAYEAQYLLKKGFTDITLVDISSAIVSELQEVFRDQPIKILHKDFFAHTGQYDLIMEQTFFCALVPSLRQAYANQMCQLLKPGGKLVGVLFDRPFEGGPPFGGSAAEYLSLFQPLFSKAFIAPCHNSIAPRADAEVWINLSH